MEQRWGGGASFATPAVDTGSKAAGMLVRPSTTLLLRQAIYFSSLGVAAITAGSKLSTLLEPPN